MTSLQNKWSAFFSAIFEPWTLACTFFTIALIGATLFVSDPKIASLLSVFASLFASVVGGLLTKHYHERTEGRILKAKGESSIRGLKLLLSNVCALDQRVQVMKARISETNQGDLPLTYLEEVVERCKTLEEESLSAIENWTDIIPEADAQTQIGVITSLRNQIEQSIIERTQLEEKLKSFDGKVAGEQKQIQELRDGISQQASQIAELNAQLRKKEITLALRGLPNPKSDMTGSGISSDLIRKILTSQRLRKIEKPENKE